MNLIPDFIYKWFNRNKSSIPQRGVMVHDYSKPHCYWGHDYEISTMSEDGRKLHILGFGSGLHVGDLFIISSGAGGQIHYEIKSIDYYSDPSDMWSANIEFI